MVGISMIQYIICKSWLTLQPYQPLSSVNQGMGFDHYNWKYFLACKAFLNAHWKLSTCLIYINHHSQWRSRQDTENNIGKARLLRQSWELSDAGCWSGGVQILWRWSWVTRWEALIVSCFQAFRPTIPEMLPCVWPPSLPRCISYAGWLAGFHSNHLIEGKVAVAYWSESQTSGWHCLILVAEKPLLSVMTSQWCGSSSTWSGRAGANFAPHHHHQAVPIPQLWQQLLLLLKTGMCVIDSN